MINLNKKNIVLCGFMGSGKTAVGNQLSKLTSRNYVDIDQYIENKSGKTISEIFAESGEQYFRDLEYEAAKELSLKKGCIISAGGGTLLYERNIQVLKENGIVIFLDVPLSTIKYRLRNDKKRPLLQIPDKDRVMEELYNQRLPLYKETADYRVDGTKSPIGVAKDICKIIRK